jgi:hypothetical protein
MQKIMGVLGKVHSYTAIAALEICHSLIREGDTKAAFSLWSQYLEQSTPETKPCDLSVSLPQSEIASA